MNTDVVELGAVEAIGNWLHGSWKTGVGFRNRAGAAFDASVLGVNETTYVTVQGNDAHLVDFDMPVVTTPAAEIALGLERWNKAILYGLEKYYSIRSARAFGRGGWPYKAPDGSVWRMLATASANLVTISATRLRDDFAGTMTVIGTFAVPDPQGRAIWVNFSPKGGNKAAVHADIGYAGLNYVKYVLEVELTGGNAGALPAVTGSVTIDETNRWSGTEGYEDITPVPVYVDTAYSESATTTDGNYWYMTRTFQVASYANESPGSEAINNAVFAITYAADGTRNVLSYYLSSGQKRIVSDFTTNHVTSYRAPYNQPGWWDATSTSGTTTYKAVRTVWDKFEFRRNGVTVCQLLIEASEGTGLDGYVTIDYTSIPTWGNTSYVAIPEVKIGNGWDASGNSIFAGMNSIDVEMTAGNAVCLIGRAYQLTRVAMYIGADFQGVRTHGNLADYATDAPRIAFNPVTGEFDPLTIRYF